MTTLYDEICEYAKECANDPETTHYAGAEGGFATEEEWADWWLAGAAGDASHALASRYDRDVHDVRRDMRAALIQECDLAAINADVLK